MEKMQTYYYRDLDDTAKTLKGRDNVFLTLKLRDMLKPTFGICPKVEQTTLDELNTATFSGLNEQKGFWVHFGLNTFENNFDSMDNGDIEAVIQVMYQFRVNAEIANSRDDKNYPCVTSGRYVFRSVVAKRVDKIITIDEEELSDLAVDIAKSLKKAKNDLNIRRKNNGFKEFRDD